MCTRYRLAISEQELLATYVAELFLDGHEPRWNLAPTQVVPILLRRGEARRIEGFHFGLVPSWARDPSLGRRLLNARSETVAEKPSFRGAWRHARRCALPADGFYEWQSPDGGEGPKIPWLVQMADGRPFAFAGIWERWGPEEAPLHTVAILTTEPDEGFRRIHDRMPVLLEGPEAWDAWIDPERSSESLRELLAAVPASRLQVRPVSRWVNDPRHEGPRCSEPLDP